MKKKKLEKIYCSPAHRKYLKKEKTYSFLVIFARVFLLLAFFGLWEIFSVTGVIDSFIFSSPSRICETFLTLWKSGDLFLHIWSTLSATLLGFLIATFLGTLFAIILYNFTFLRKMLEPYLVVLNSLPKIALGPIIIVWFGVGKPAIILMAVLILIILTTLNMLAAFLNTDEGKIKLLKSMGASKMQILFKLILPNSLPEFISTLKINVGLSWVGTIMGEYLASQAGLGYLLVFGGQVFKLDLVMTSIMILCTLAALMYFFVSLLEKYTLKKFR